MTEPLASSSTQAGRTLWPPTAPSFRVSLRTLGCKVNQADSEDILVALLGEGHALVPEEEAEVVIVNTCTVTAEADRKARKVVRHALALPSAPVVLVTGCMAAVDPEAIEGLGERVVVEADKTSVLARVAGLLSAGPQGMPVEGSSSDSADRLRTAPAKSRVMLKVQDGCDVFCSYCIVPHARGLPRSVPLEEVVTEARRLVSDGVREMVLTGVNLGTYEDGSARLPGLVRAVADTGVENLRLSSIEPPYLTDDLLQTLAATDAVCEHLHVPLQSGSDPVLKAMGRGYDIAFYEERVQAARSLFPRLAVTTDVMVGFPGESEEDFSQTMEACERIAFTKMHVFRYSERPGTPAAEMGGAVDPGERSRRAARLRDLAVGLREVYMESRVGEEALLLVEGRVPSDPSVVYGTTRDYLKVECGPCEVPIGKTVQVRLVSRTGSKMLARPL